MPLSSYIGGNARRGNLVRSRKPPQNDNSYRNSSNNFRKEDGAGATVDITTKGLYDKIQFLDEDGGPWKQGWRVSYKGDEWDSEKLKVFVVPHSHNDPGWKLTVDEYYDMQSRHILDTIVHTLSKDPRRKFIWEEMSYLERWWRDASVEKRESFTNLIKTGQLEIVGGGWVMNDEANSHYFAIIEQITEGNMWLNDTIGVVPKNSWAIDPFGYSPTMAYLLRRMGFENMLIQRTHYELKKELALKKNLEYTWRQSWDTEESTDIFTHMMPFYSYDIPHTCGPEPAICCEFDFARMHGFNYELCPWGKHPVAINQENIQERALKLLDQYRKKSTLYRTNTLLVPLGDDFRYISIDEAEAQFHNYQMLFDYINSNPSLNAEAKFGTLDDYFQTLREEADRVNYSLPGEIGSGQIGGFPSLSGDFFTYADRQQDYWSGYYISRPFFKAVDRVLEQTLRAAEIMMALVHGYCQRAQCEKLATGFAYKMTAARRNLALFQHHDGVTGTAKDHVVQDYGIRMHTSLQDLQIFMSKSIEVLLGIHHEKSDHSPSQFESAQVRSKYDVQPVLKAINAREGTSQSVVLFNPLEQTRDEVVMVIVKRPDVTVLDSNWTCVPSQVSPELQHDNSKIFTGRHRLHWKASVPAMGLQTYYVANGSNGKRFSVHSRQSLGAASLKDGWLEIMLDRRLLRDDGRGLGQGVMDNRPMNVIFHILFESNISSTSDPVSNPLPLSPSLLSHCVGAHLNYPLHAFVAKIPHELSVQPPPRSFSPLAAPLPCDLHIVNFKVPRPSKYSQQPIEDYRGLEVLKAKATSLNLLHEDIEMLGYMEQVADVGQEGHAFISPMEIQAYKLVLRPHQ
ncbi:ALPHA-MANNOSIDASE 2X [Salix purpurea]|uniref:Alpha-mannosidase n=1 Tax=Salix purpurea TaxID=77065 RepID=A0A9Q0VTE2_SALPP|nr:ALPHA-MANNOSIDASE 2X [Salix purpurea]